MEPKTTWTTSTTAMEKTTSSLTWLERSEFSHICSSQRAQTLMIFLCMDTVQSTAKNWKLVVETVTWWEATTRVYRNHFPLLTFLTDECI